MIAKHNQSPGVLFDKASVDRPGRSQIIVAIEDLLDAFTVLLEKLDRVSCDIGWHWVELWQRPHAADAFGYMASQVRHDRPQS
jgi:hypothetical protein